MDKMDGTKIENGELRMEKLDGKSKDITAENIQKLKELFPEAFTEGKVDFDALKEVLGTFVDDRDERYSFTWNGKSKARMIAQTPSTGTLRPCKEESVDWDTTQNIFIEGDNLEVLKLLQKSYHKKVKMIYIDPPYNTGKDFVYKDNFKDNIKNYKEITGQVDGEGRNLSNNPETSGRYHTDWLNMMYPRLKLARNLLKDDGVICLSIDENEISNLRTICDEIFGEENLLFQITLLCNPKGRSQDKYIANCHEYIVGYSKQVLDKGVINVPKDSDEIEKNYKLSDQRGKYRELELRNTHREFGKHNRKNLYYPFYVNREGAILLEEKDDFVAIYPIWDDGFEGCWTWGQEKARNQLDEIVAKEVKGNWKIYRKNYAENDDGQATKQVKSIWTEKEYHTEKGQNSFNTLFETNDKIFQSPKSVETIKQLLLMASHRDSIILDFFAGSATTAHSTMQLNTEDGGSRKFIMAQLPEPCDENTEAYKSGYKTIAEISKERIRRAAAKIKEDIIRRGEKFFAPTNLDLGFKVFKLDSTNIKPWEVDFDLTERTLEDFISNIKPDRREEDVLYEILLKYGLDLTLPIDEWIMDNGKLIMKEERHSQLSTLNSQLVYSIGMGALIICLADAISLEVVEGMAKLKEELNPEIMRVVFKDSGFKDDVVKTNAVQILKQAGIVDVKSI